MTSWWRHFLECRCFVHVVIKLKAIEHPEAKKCSLQSWLICGALIVRRIFSTVRCNVLAEIDSVLIATTVSNLGELLLDINMQYQPRAVYTSHALTANCMYVAKRWTLTVPSVQKRYYWMSVSRIRQLRMNWRRPPSSVPTKTVPGRDPESFTW